MTFDCYGCKRVHDDFNWKTLYINSHLRTVCSLFFTPSVHEFIPDRIIEERKQFKREITQPFRGGEASREFIDAYPEKAKKMMTEKEIKNAKKVWD